MDKLTVKQLREKLKEKNLPVSGKKADLIERLTKSSPRDTKTNDVWIIKIFRRKENGRSLTLIEEEFTAQELKSDNFTRDGVIYLLHIVGRLLWPYSPPELILGEMYENGKFDDFGRSDHYVTVEKNNIIFLSTNR